MLCTSLFIELCLFFNFQCLCLAPTYELALQIGKNVEQMGQKMDSLRVCYAVRGERGNYHQKLVPHTVFLQF
jgi:ATP-dependent RNA helicase DDX19/DBP5